MYFAAELSFDPSSATQIERTKPTKAFGRFFYFLTAGIVSDELEVEAFVAVSLLQQINVALRSVDVTNIVRLACDGEDFYLDRQGRPDDLQSALAALERDHRASTPGKSFDNLALVLEHEHAGIRYLIEIEIARTHPPGEHPIALDINGVPPLSLGAEDAQAAKAQLAPLFASQATHDEFIATHREKFEAFVAEIREAITRQVRVDDVSEWVGTKVLRPQRRRSSIHDDIHYDEQRGAHGTPLFGGYHGFPEIFFHGWLWSELMHDHGIQARDLTLVDEAGNDVVQIGSDGVDPSDAALLDPDGPLIVPGGLDAVALDGGVAGGSGSGFGWLDGAGDSAVDGGGASCSSCGSCGGD